MEEGLAEINAVAGVRGSFICDNRGEVIVSAMPAALNSARLNEIGHEVTQTMAGLEIAGEAMTELDFMYDRARIVGHDLANAVLVALCDPRVEIATLRLTLNVVTSRLKGDSGIQSQLEARTVEKEVVQDDVDEASWYLLQTIQGKEVNDA
jgi:predicted regulator of Ras-like GTPase activity (Roadblock/LC7/MglB family)